MLAPVAWFTVAFSAVLAVWCLIAAIRGDRPSKRQLIAATALWGLLVVQAVGGFVALALTDRRVDGITFVGYHLTAVTVLIAGAAWGIADRSRWGNGVFAIAAATEVVLVIRLLQLWAGQH